MTTTSSTTVSLEVTPATPSEVEFCLEADGDQVDLVAVFPGQGQRKWYVLRINSDGTFSRYVGLGSPFQTDRNTKIKEVS